MNKQRIHTLALPCAVLVTLLPNASVIAQSSPLQELERISSEVETRHARTEVALQRLLETESEFIRERARQRADDWYQNGVSDYEQEEYSTLVDNLRLLHQIEELDFSDITSLYTLIHKRIIGLDIIYKGRDELSFCEDGNPVCESTPRNEQAASSANDWRLPQQHVDKLNIELFRERLIGNLQGIYVSALAEPTPVRAREKMLNFNTFIESMAGADRALMDLEIAKIEREYDHLLYSMIPLLGDALAVVEAYHGQDAVGRQLSWLDQAMSVIGAFGGIGDLVIATKLAGMLPANASNTLNLLGGHIDQLTPAQRALINERYPDLGIQTLEDFRSDITGLRNMSADEMASIVDAADPVGMRVARESLAEQRQAFTDLGYILPDELNLLQYRANVKVETNSPAFDLDLLQNPGRMDEAQLQSLGRSLDLEDDELAELLSDPSLATGFVERFTGVPMSNLRVHSDTILDGEFSVMRNSNPDGLAHLSAGTALPKPLFVKGKSGRGGFIYSDQEFSQLSLDLEKAIAEGDEVLELQIRNDIARQNLDVESITRERELGQLRSDLIDANRSGDSTEINRIEEQISFIENTRLAESSDRVGDRTIVATMVTDADGREVRSVMLRDDNGNLFDINNGNPFDGNARILRTPEGEDVTISRVVDKRTGLPYVADSDTHIWGVQSDPSDLVSQDAVGGFISNTEQQRMIEIAIQQREAGNVPMLVHGAQVRYYSGELPVDEVFYVIEKGQLRIVRNDGSQLQDLLHMHRLNGTISPVDSRWGFGTWSPRNGFTQ